MATPRRIGGADSATRAKLVDAAERLLLREGYAAVTSRRVGREAETNAQLVHYYFRTMDDLFLAIFRRRADEGFERFHRALAESPSLRTIWDHEGPRAGTSFNIEFVALANHRKAIRDEIARTAERFRSLQLEAIAKALAARGLAPDDYPPVVVLLAMTGITQVIELEEALGVTAGHDETRSFVRRFLSALDGEPSATD